MKKFYQFLFLLSALVMTGSLWSCSDDDNSGDGSSPIEVLTPTSDEIFTTSVTFKLKTQGAESYVYKVEEGHNASQPDPVLVYAEAEENGTVVPVSGDTAEETVAGLEGGEKDYTVFFIFKVGSEYKICSQNITTAPYSQKVTIIESTMFSIKLHVDVPDEMYYTVGCIKAEDYISLVEMYGWSDAAWVTYNEGGGMQSPRYKGPQNITLENGVSMYKGALNEADYADLSEEEKANWIYPGTGYVIFFGQCDENGMTDDYYTAPEGGDFPGELLATLPNVKEYTEEKPEGYIGAFAKTTLFTKQATEGKGNIQATLDRATEQTLIMTFTPSDDILQYSLVMIDDAEKESFTHMLGGEDGIQAAVLNYGSLYDGVQQLAYGVTLGHTYTVYIVGVYNEEGTIQSFQKIENLAPVKSDKPAVELVATPLTFDGDPYNVGFNVKAPNGDCAAFRYILNYTHEWYPTLNQMGGVTEETIANMFAMYGQGINDAEILQQVNSAEGYNMYFSTMDDTESWLMLESYNEDEKTKLIYEGDNLRVKSPALTPEKPVNSELFTKLLGNWEATLETTAGVTKTMDVNIAEGPVQVDVLPADIEKTLIEYYVKDGKTEEQAKKLVEGYFNEYKEKAVYYTNKNKNQNCLVATGFKYHDYYAKFASSWDLFYSADYSAYSTDELFRDYGPKLYLKVAKDQNGQDSLSVIVTRYNEDYSYYRYVDPVSNWYYSIGLNAYNAENPGTFYTTEFPVEVSEDLNTLTIKPVVQDGLTYSPAFTYEMSPGYPSWNCITKDGIVLKRVSDATTTALTRSNVSIDIPKVSAQSGKNRFRRTRAPYDYLPAKSAKGSVFSLDTFKKNIKK